MLLLPLLLLLLVAMGRVAVAKQLLKERAGLTPNQQVRLMWKTNMIGVALLLFVRTYYPTHFQGLGQSRFHVKRSLV